MSMSADTIVRFSLDALLLAAAGLNMFLAHRNIKGWRTIRAIRQIGWSYVRDLQQQGVELPPRCFLCCQILPDHVEGCGFEETMKRELGALTERLTRPAIKYYPRGEKPPEWKDWN
jgi:hypothetical protein